MFGVPINTIAKGFQNISCLRLIRDLILRDRVCAAFQNISCLRLITAMGAADMGLTEFQNISCLRLILLKNIIFLK